MTLCKVMYSSFYYFELDNVIVDTQSFRNKEEKLIK